MGKHCGARHWDLSLAETSRLGMYSASGNCDTSVQSAPKTGILQSFNANKPLKVCTITTSFISKVLPSRQKKWNQAVQERVALTSKMMSNMKTVKMMGFSDYIGATLQAARLTELAASAGFRRCMAVVNTLGTSPDTTLSRIHVPLADCVTVLVPRQISAPLTLTLFVLAVHNGSAAGRLSASQAFTTLAIIEIITTPLALLLQTLPSLTSSLACLDRVQTYLKSPERIDPRAKDVIRNDDLLMEKNIIKPIDSDQPIVSLLQASFAYNATDSHVLNSISFTVPHGGITIVVGPIGSGKSSLLKSILGESVLREGELYVCSGRIAYCDQNPWIPNGSVRDCIIGNHDGSFDSSWYDDVIHTCALEEDIDSFMDGSDSSVGSRGIALSDGQKHRLARINLFTLLASWLIVAKGTCKGDILSLTLIDIG